MPSDLTVYFVYEFWHGDVCRYVGKTKHRIRATRTHAHIGGNDDKSTYFQVHRSEMKSRRILEGVTHEIACAKEQELIARYGLLCDGTGSLLNRTHGAGSSSHPRKGEALSFAARRSHGVSMKGRSLSLEHRAKLKGRTRSEATKANMRAGWAARTIPPKGHEQSEVTKVKISATLKGRPLSAERKTKMKGRSSSFKGRTHSDAARAKMSAATKGRPSSMKGRHHSEATKAKISASLIGHVCSQKGLKRSSETKAKMRAAWAARTPAQREAQTRPAALLVKVRHAQAKQQNPEAYSAAQRAASLAGWAKRRSTLALGALP
jgi:hypothetical protein